MIDVWKSDRLPEWLTYQSILDDGTGGNHDDNDTDGAATAYALGGDDD